MVAAATDPKLSLRPVDTVFFLLQFEAEEAKVRHPLIPCLFYGEFPVTLRSILGEVVGGKDQVSGEGGKEII